jgi:hypothetical protein
MAEAGERASAQASAGAWDAQAEAGDNREQDIPVVESPSISSDWPASADAGASQTADADWPQAARNDLADDLADDAAARPRQPSWFRKLLQPPALPRATGKSLLSLPTACAAMGALVLALVIWRGDMVRLLPQTAAFYKMVGLEVNLRGLAFKDVKLSTETVEGKQVLVIEGVIVGQGKKPLDIPRLRFAVRDAQGAEIYAWNSVLEQTVLQPGERAFFRSRLASPPPEGRNIDVRFFNRRDIAGGSV